MKKSKFLSSLIFFLPFVFLCLVLTLNAATAGKLGDFKDDATKPKKEHRTSEDNQEDEDDNGGCLGIGFNILFDVMFQSTDQDPNRTDKPYLATDSSTHSHGDPWAKNQDKSGYDHDNGNNDPIAKTMDRKTGDYLFPFFREDTTYHVVESDVDAIDYMGIVGYGPIGFMARKTFYKEENPRDTLDIYQHYFLFRFPVMENIEVDLGLGQVVLDGNPDNSGFAITTPVLYQLNKYLGFELRPAWTSINGNSIADYDLSIRLGIRFVSLKAGYRWVESENQSLRGHFAGISFIF